ncbi:helix-turn-helix domain-containing protein [Leucobacter viscericola]|uniref:Helix-turn-helix domain-containing protein n=2 Tax=Leucobacter viscericola TaxID=2714935 RepID=A0A6G7XCH1_9MICO|nr:helix-turn-helix domain-containing protein [Leucobacter viscericola]
MTIEELAERSEVSPRAISDIERGVRQTPHRRTIAALSRGMKLSPEEASELEQKFHMTRVRNTAATYDSLPLPRISPEFIGRTDQQFEICEALSDDQTGAVVVVTGSPGIGKTSLAVRVAHAVEKGFQHVAFVDLGGLGEVPLSSVEVARRLISGIAPTAIQAPSNQVLDQLQSVIQDRRVLIILDNADNETQVRPLLPPRGPSAVLVTSRHRLAGLVGVTHVALPPLSTTESVSFLEQVLSSGPHNKTDLHDLARLCSNVPLALRIAANQVNAFPARTVAHVVARLESTEYRLDTLTAGDLSLAAACQSSYEQLDATTQLVFRRLGLADSAVVSIGIASLLSELPELETRQALDHLAELSLLDPTDVDKYTVHELLWLFAKNRLEQTDSREDLLRARATTDQRVLESAAIAGSFLSGSKDFIATDWFDAPLFRGDSSQEAIAWLNEERPEWHGAMHRAAAQNEHERLGIALRHLHWFSKVWHYQSPWADLFGLGGYSAEQIGHYPASCLFYGEQLWFLLSEGENHAQADAVANLMDQAAIEADSPGVLAWADYYRARLLLVRGQLTEALIPATRAAETMRAMNESAVALFALQQQAEVLILLGRIEEGLEVLRESRALFLTHQESIGALAATLAHANGARLIAQTNRETGNWKATIEASTIALSALNKFDYLPTHPLMAVILTFRAIAYEEDGQISEAMVDRSRIRELSELP